MRERVFVGRRQDGWERLEALLARADRSGLRRLGAAELRELGMAYRATTSDLAAAQSRAYSPELRGYLNRLTARAHAYVYVESVRGGWSHIAHFFGTVFPREVRASGGVVLACTALFAAAWIVSYALVSARPLSVYALLPASEIPLVQKSLHDSNFAFARTSAPAISSAIITNNIKVAAVAFAGGMTVGAVTIFAILNNGLMVGGLGALFAHKGFGTDFWATIAPHGVLELSAIQLAGTAGLLLAKAIVAPGRLRRIDALKANARRAGVLMLGVAGMLVVAGAIEGFFTPLRTPLPLRFGVGAFTALLLTAYLTLGGRESRATTVPVP